MKMFLIVYCEAADYDVISSLKKTGIRTYTKMEEACGEGTDTEPKLGTHCWPGKNKVLFIAVQEEEVPVLRDLINKLRTDHPRAGVKAFILPMEEIV